MLKWVLGSIALLAFGWVVWALVLAPERREPPPPGGSGSAPRELTSTRHLTVWWDDLGYAARQRARSTGPAHNIHPDDYAGPDSCKTCHPNQHQSWSGHPHRWMNALAGGDTVRGDFSGASINYRGGSAVFEKRDGAYVMSLAKGDAKRTYRINQTIGARAFQYYVGTQVAGPEPAEHHFYHKDHVLPFGYWLAKKEWVPVVHIGPEKPDDERADPYHPPDSGVYYAEYAASCNSCHTTFPLGDLFARRPHQVSEHAPARLHYSVGSYLKETHPAEHAEVVRQMAGASGPMTSPLADWEAPKYAVTLGVSCEACHLGAKEHVASGGKVRPRFFPESPHLSVEAAAAPDPGRTHANLNWACARCHTGGRPTFAAGMSTWNSVEFSDAAKGSCYSQIRCIDCHDPHTAIGPTWKVPAEREDAVCLKCHQQYKEPTRRAGHTHHAPGSEGDRCLNCHMPRLNEGLSEVVRTHMIYSPTRADMIHAGQPNACNLCHTDQSIDWTLGRLKDWYGKTYDDLKIAANYSHRDRPAAVDWVTGKNEAVRLVAAAALTRQKDQKALPHLIDMLDDPYLVNRQFTADGLERMLGVRLADHGYRFYQTRDERRGPLAAVRAKLLRPGGP
jgi:predicted CXXCH cytochrome family protein